MSEKQRIGFIKINENTAASNDMGKEQSAKKERNVGFGQKKAEFKRKDKIKVGEIKIEKKEFEPKDPKIWDVLYFGSQLLSFGAYRKMLLETKDTEDYKTKKEKWQKYKDMVLEYQKKLPAEALDIENSASYLEINISEEKVKEKFDQLRNELKAKGVTDEDIDVADDTFKKEMSSVADEPSVDAGGAKNDPIGDGDVKEPEPQSAIDAPKAANSNQNIGFTAPVETKNRIETKHDAWMGTWDTYTGGKAPEDVAAVKRYVERVAKSQGKNTLAYAYAESLLKNAQEKPARDVAEENRKTVEALQIEKAKLLKELEEAKRAQAAGGGVFEEPKDAKISRLEREIEKNKKEAEPAKQGWGSKFAQGFKNLFKKAGDAFKRKNASNDLKGLDENGWIDKKPEPGTLGEALREERVVEIRDAEEAAKITETPEERGGNLGRAISELQKSVAEKKQTERKKIKGSSVLGWFKERAKGFATFGLWEVGRATGFLVKTENAGADTSAQSDLLKQEGGLMDKETAQEEAAEIKSRLQGEVSRLNPRTGVVEYSSRSYENLSKEISAENAGINKRLENLIVASSLKRLEDKLKNKVLIGNEYMRANGGKMLTPERLAEIEKRLREEMGKIRRGQIKKDSVNFGRLYRQSLDRKWWTRYIYGPVEAAAWFLAYKWVTSSGVENIGSGSGPTPGPESVPGPEVIEPGPGSVDIGLKDTIWDDTKDFMMDHGWDNPTDANVMEYAKMVAEDSGVAVKEWGMGGEIIDTQMPGGYLLKFGRVAAELAKLGY
ncbi:MAG: hypothetical protein Q7S32_04710 [bacterium]|nr:hypothetical protein [bacterium]